MSAVDASERDQGSMAPYSDLRLPGGDGRPYTVINMVTSVDGKASLNGQSRPVSSAADRAALVNIRRAVDAILVGARSLAAEEIPYRPLRDLASTATNTPAFDTTVVVFSNSGNLPLQRQVFQRQRTGLRLFVATTRPIAERLCSQLPAHASLLAFGEREVDITEVLQHLWRELGIQRAVLEGGPSLNAAMLAAGLVDELFVTYSARLVGGQETTIVSGHSPLAAAPRPLRLLSVLQHGDDLYCRYRLAGSEAIATTGSE